MLQTVLNSVILRTTTIGFVNSDDRYKGKDLCVVYKLGKKKVPP